MKSMPSASRCFPVPDPPGYRSIVAMFWVIGVVFASGSPAAGAPCAAVDLPCQLRVITEKLHNVGQTLTSMSAKVLDNAKKMVNIDEQIQALKKFQDALLETKDEVLSLAKQGSEFAKYHAARELLEIQQFVGSGDSDGACKGFREELISFVTGLEGASNDLIQLERLLASSGAAPSPLRLPDIDFSAIKKALSAIPAFVLYPPYKALVMVAGSPDKVTLKPMIDILAAIRAAASVPPNLGEILADCASVRAPVVRDKLVGISMALKLANGVKLFAEILKAMGKTSANGTNAGLAAGGHVSLRIQHDCAGTLGSFLGGFADFALGIARAIDARLDHCELVVNQETLMCQMESPPGTSRVKCRPTPKFTQLEK